MARGVDPVGLPPFGNLDPDSNFAKVRVVFVYRHELGANCVVARQMLQPSFRVSRNTI